MNDQESVSGNTITRIVRPVMPIDGGYVSDPGTAFVQMPVYSVGAGNFVYAHQNYLDYLAHAFLGWRGSIRYIIDTSRAGCCHLSTTVSRSPLERLPEIEYQHPDSICVICNPSPTASLSALYTFAGAEHKGQNGSSISTNSIDSVTTVEIPYYSDYRFFPSRHLSRLARSVPYNTTVPDQFWSILIQGREVPNDVNAALWAAGGEDFSPYFFLGSPPIHFNAFVPQA